MTSFTDIYETFLSKITDDMYMQMTQEDTEKILEQLLISAIPYFEFPRISLDYIQDYFLETLSKEEINILATYMIVEWLGQQLASIQNTRMKYSGPDFKFTSQASHMQKVLQLKKDYERLGRSLQRLYKRRIKDENGIYRSTFGTLMEKQPKGGTGLWGKWF